MATLRLQRPIGDKVTKMDLGMRISEAAETGKRFSAEMKVGRVEIHTYFDRKVVHHGTGLASCVALSVMS
jgi:hypothetical protein